MGILNENLEGKKNINELKNEIKKKFIKRKWKNKKLVWESIIDAISDYIISQGELYRGVRYKKKIKEAKEKEKKKERNEM